MRVVGVDGCRGGWLSVALDVVTEDGPASGNEAAVADRPAGASGLEHPVSPDFADVLARASDAALVLVDIPIGLLEDGSIWRAPDLAARARLGARRSSVFPVPPRPVLHAPDYPAANALTRELTGKGLSKQAWMIVPKIREVDEALRARPELVGRVREVHPEVCFHAFAGGRPMAHAKKTADGAAERIALLESRLPGAGRLVDRIVATAGRVPTGRGRRTVPAVARDDAVDALVAARTAAAIVADPRALRTLPEAPERDAHGIPMEMVYADGKASNPSIADWNCVS